jgi:uncharacterized protein YndB with AHSA1/START domain
MEASSRHISIEIDRSPSDVYEFASDPANLPLWASGIGDSIALVDGDWVVDSPTGRFTIAFAPRNDLGVLDHDVTLASGEHFYNPMRVIEYGDGSEVVFTLRHAPDQSDEAFETDAATIVFDLATLKRLLEV